jgi:hypothetical protein
MPCSTGSGSSSSSHPFTGAPRPTEIMRLGRERAEEKHGSIEDAIEDRADEE